MCRTSGKTPEEIREWAATAKVDDDCADLHASEIDVLVHITQYGR